MNEKTPCPNASPYCDGPCSPACDSTAPAEATGAVERAADTTRRYTPPPPGVQAAAAPDLPKTPLATITVVPDGPNLIVVGTDQIAEAARHLDGIEGWNSSHPGEYEGLPCVRFLGARPLTRTEVVALLTRFQWQLSGTSLTGAELWEHPNGMDELIIPAKGRESAPDAGRLLRGVERVIARAEGPRLLGVVREVAALHPADWSCGNPRHTTPEVGCPDCGVVCAGCGENWPCPTARAVQALTETTEETNDES